MTCFDADPSRSTFELPLETATARIAALQGEIDRTRSVETHAGPLHDLRTTIGRGLIALGSVIAPAAAPNASTGKPTAVSR